MEPKAAPSISNDSASEVADSERLRHIEVVVEELRQAALKDARKEIEDKKKGSRSAVTIAFAAAGAKIGSLIASKGIFFGEAAKQIQRKKGELYEEFKRETDNKGDREAINVGFQKMFALLETDFLKEIGMKALIWGSVGAAIGGLIGWARGDRIHDVHDLIKHPIDSLKKILGFKPKDPEPQVNLAQPPAKTQDTVIPPKEEDTKNRADWQSKEQAARNEKAEAVEASAFLAM